jgi:hypothetical protein
MIFASTVEHLADSASGSSGCPRNLEKHDSEVQSPNTVRQLLKDTGKAKNEETPVCVCVHV